jgi:outer membrane usher protein FimD/PapC
MKCLLLPPLAVCIGLALSHSIFAQELDLSFLQGGSQLDSQTWAQLNSKYAPGRYLVDVSLNNKGYGKRILTVTPKEGEALCLSKAWLDDAGIFINPVFYQSTFNVEDKCYVLTKESNTHIDFDFTSQSLSFSLPQAGIEKTVKNVNDWNYGTSALRLNYNINGNVNDTSTDFYASSGIMANVGHWIVNSSFNVSQNEANINVASATRAIQSLKADLIIGKTYGGSSLTGGASMLGFGLSSNSAMLPNDIGYSPVFTGVAKTHARVTLLQNSNVVYSELVPPGPFEINDVNLLNSGDVTMVITETDGSKTEQLFPLTVISNMLNPGEVEYDINVGVRDDNDNDADGKLNGLFSSASIGYGFDHYTLRSSLLAHQRYINGGLGVTRGLGNFGTLSAQGAYAFGKYDNGQSRTGSKVSLTYAKTFNQSTSFQVANTLYTSENYTEFSSFKPWDFVDDDRTKPKMQYSASLTHRTEGQTSFSLSGWQRTFFGEDDSQLGLSVSMLANFDNFNLSLGSTYSHVGNDESYGVSASISIPFSMFDKKFNTYTTMSSDLQGAGTVTAGVSSLLTDDLSYSLSTGWNYPNGEQSYSLQSSYQGDRVMGSMAVSQSPGNTTGSASLTGSVIALPEQRDFIFTRNTTDTVAIANIKNTPGVKFAQSPYPTNNKGNAVIPISSYDVNNITLDGSTLPIDTELLTTNEDIVPTGSAVVYVPFGSVNVKRYLLQIKDRQGQFIKNGTWAATDAGVPLGFITQNGVLFINSIDKPKEIRLGQCVISGQSLKDTITLQEVTCEK